MEFYKKKKMLEKKKWKKHIYKIRVFFQINIYKVCLIREKNHQGILKTNCFEKIENKIYL